MILLFIFIVLICFGFVKLIIKLIAGSAKQASKYSKNYQDDIRASAIADSMNKDGQVNTNSRSNLEVQKQSNKNGAILWTIITFGLIFFFAIIFIFSNI